MEQASGVVNGGSLRPNLSTSTPKIPPKLSPISFSHSLSSVTKILDPRLTPPMYLSDEDRAPQKFSHEYDDWDQQDKHSHPYCKLLLLLLRRLLEIILLCFLSP
uniref:Uncharacterized protein n=1 Tax=Cannabis sativa TaxID=3483 RepID=A0A803P8F2_CANSA